MIVLRVEGYCQNCPDFEADVDVSRCYGMNVNIINTLITCKHCERCASHMRYLEAEKFKEEQQ